MQHQSNNLSPLKQQKLRKLLDDDAMEILVEVLESKAFAHEVTAANHLREARGGHDAEAKEEMRKANTIHDGIAILRELRAATNFAVSTATPNTKTTKST